MSDRPAEKLKFLPHERHQVLKKGISKLLELIIRYSHYLQLGYLSPDDREHLYSLKNVLRQMSIQRIFKIGKFAPGSTSLLREYILKKIPTFSTSSSIYRDNTRDSRAKKSLKFAHKTAHDRSFLLLLLFSIRAKRKQRRPSLLLYIRCAMDRLPIYFASPPRADWFGRFHCYVQGNKCRDTVLVDRGWLLHVSCLLWCSFKRKSRAVTVASC